MKILHGTWIPQATDEFIQKGTFYIWVETDASRKRKKELEDSYPFQLEPTELANLLSVELGIAAPSYNPLVGQIVPKYFLLPSEEGKPLASLELLRYLEKEPPETTQLKAWTINCYPVVNIISFLNDAHFLCLYKEGEIQLGADLLFWYHYTQAFQEVILKDQYIPAWQYRELEQAKDKKQHKRKAFEIYPTWEIVCATYEANVQRYLDYIPAVCLTGSEQPPTEAELYQPETLLRHFSECLLHQIILGISLPAAFEKKIADCPLLMGCLHPHSTIQPWSGENALEQYRQWQKWKQKLVGTQKASPFYLGLQLIEAREDNTDDWQLKFLVIPKEDPSWKIELEDYWHLPPKPKRAILEHLGEDFEKNLLLNLGQAAQMYPAIWQGLESDKPIGFPLTLVEAFSFLKESAWLLEDAGFKVIIPAWWTPEGRQRAKIRLKAKGKKLSASGSKGKSFFGLETIIEYQYELAIGEQSVTLEEWQQLVNSKKPLIKFRGQWVELDPNKMEQMLNFWQTKQDENPEMTLLELMQRVSQEAEELEVDPDASLEEMLTKLRNSDQLEPIENPSQLQGTLREYQKRGVAWLIYLEKLGLNGCLADDMGLGKTIQVIALLIKEKESQESVLPTLLIAPTSVVGNWRKEIEKFAPHLKTMSHHGSIRHQEESEFIKACQEVDVVITSFNLVRKDLKLLKSQEWQRVVVDEAQNIKNPKAAQTKAILSLEAQYRLALTGTPVENRLLDLWSIFNFLNPGYLGKEAQFRKTFEIPIQKQNNPRQSTVLKKLVEPFILRRLKTDKQIIKDLPDKVENKQYCNLTKEQASLYEVVVKDVAESLDETEGIQRKGLILSTLLRLKQISNHPRQFLQDNSEFTSERSSKLERLQEMVQEVIAEEESLLIFTQFTEIGESLAHYLKQTFYYNTYYLHGGTSQPKREKMIEEFQNPDTEPSIFILSLKAGGVGITLTKANHVFHFDRWWNPAVENQATDRAFRIGQQKNVFVHKFVTLGTLEERIDEMIENKKKLAEAIVGSDESWLTELDNESFKKLIALNKQTIL